ncbi:MAG TPA: class I SAM-dependent methyltransferase [Cyclobacteriaceae bacterium]|nr:class I SAM-dependent methyltransferase [Cyclobacteriaceae bacterium]
MNVHASENLPNEDSVNRAFTAQAAHYDTDDLANPVIGDLRHQVYDHLSRYMKPQSRILELNAGTGIDALYFASKGHTVLATDLSDGMITELNRKAASVNGRIAVKQLSYDRLDEINDEKFDYIFSNFGGLNCIDELARVTQHLPGLLKPGGHVTFVIMPVICGWELLSTVKGDTAGFRRLKTDGVTARIDNEYFHTWYHSFTTIRKAFGDGFTLVGTEGLAAISPPPYRSDFPNKHPRLYRLLRTVDKMMNRTFPFNRWADHIVTTFRLKA